MKYSNPASLAIIACPGGEVFADEVIIHLKKLYRRYNERQAAELARRYDMDAEKVSGQINFIDEIVFYGKNKHHVPKLKIPVKFTCFPNGEFKTEIQESIRGKDVYIFQDVENHYPLRFSGCENDGRRLSINDHLIMLFVTIDAARQAGAGQITLVIPNYPYARQHKAKGREALTASRIGKMFEGLGVYNVITLDIHSRDIMNSFTQMRLENLHASYQIIRTLTNIDGILNDDFVVVSPDTGAVDRNKFFASALKKPLALLYKERDYSKISKSASETNISQIRLLGNVRNKTVFMADDMLGTGGTLIKGMKILKENGARRIICSISLPLFSGDAVTHLENAYREGLFFRIIGTNAIYQEEVLEREWYISVNISSLFAQVIARLHRNLSISSLLDNREIINRLLAGAKEQDSQNELPFQQSENE
ncbi:MAG: ribose-phosphate diphosphokinase [Treponema sp.]|nr:ribose-phosphate diphosphokinase [Treponema sp.]